MPQAPLTPNQIQAVFQALTIGLLNGRNVFTPWGPKNVRIGWQTQGQPTGTIDQDIITVRCVEEDDEYNRVSEIQYNEETLNKVVTYTRVWRTFWTLEGPNSFDNARLIRTMIRTDQTTHDVLATSQLYWVGNTSAPRRVPQVWPGNQWGERVDFESLFNEAVTEQAVEQTVLSTEVGIYDNFDNQIADITVEAGLGYGEGPYGEDPFGQ